MTLKDYQHNSVLCEVISLDGLSTVPRYVHVSSNKVYINFVHIYCSMTWIEIGGTTYKLGGLVIVAVGLLPEFAQIVDIVVTDKSKCFFVKYMIHFTSVSTIIRM